MKQIKLWYFLNKIQFKHIHCKLANLTKRTYFNSSECEMLRVWSLVVSFHLIKVTKSPAAISFMAIPHFLIFFYILQLFCNLKLPATLIDTSCLIVRQPMRIQEQMLLLKNKNFTTQNMNDAVNMKINTLNVMVYVWHIGQDHFFRLSGYI